jgi:nickel transport protein
MIRLSLYAVIVIALLACSVIVFAHAAMVWAEVKGNQVHVEAYFSGGSKVKNARIVVMDANEQQLLEGKTDENGQFNFTPPNRDDMTIVLIVDGGHQDAFELKAEELAAVELP